MYASPTVGTIRIELKRIVKVDELGFVRATGLPFLDWHSRLYHGHGKNLWTALHCVPFGTLAVAAHTLTQEDRAHSGYAGYGIG